MVVVWPSLGPTVSVTGGEIESAIRASYYVADATEDPLEKCLVRLHGGKVGRSQDDTVQVLTGHCAKEKIVRQLRKPIARVEGPAGRSDCWRKGEEGRFQPRAGLLVVNHRPAIILASLNAVELVPTYGAVKS